VGCSGGLQRSGEEPARVSTSDLAGAEERFDPREPGSDGCLRCLHSRLWAWAA